VSIFFRVQCHLPLGESGTTVVPKSECGGLGELTLELLWLTKLRPLTEEVQATLGLRQQAQVMLVVLDLVAELQQQVGPQLGQSMGLVPVMLVGLDTPLCQAPFNLGCL